MHHRTAIAALVLFILLTAGCGDTSEENADGVGSTTTSAATSTTSEASSPTEGSSSDSSSTTEASSTTDDADGSPVGRQLDWVVGFLNRGELADGEAEERFSPTFLAEIPPAQLVAILPQLTALATPPYEVDSAEESPDGLNAEAVLTGSDGGRLTVQLVVGEPEPNLIEGLLVTPTELAFPQPIEIGAIDERLAGHGPRSSLGLYEVTTGECVAVHEVRADEPVVLGSVFKLWVLAALANEIEAGRATWDETIPVTDELRSNPTGDLYQLETGTELSLEELAAAMISISDNTATDLLMQRLGREAVEAAMIGIGVDDPAANIPMLSTGNLFVLKFWPEPPNATDYRDLDEAGRRALLEELDGAVPPWVGDATPEELTATTNAEGVPITEPRDLDIEWFATAHDLCLTLLELDRLAGIAGLEPVASILEINPGNGIPFDRDRLSTIRFKGGSEPGVVAVAWWFENTDGERYVLAGGVADPEAPLDEVDALLTLASAIELVE